MIYKQSDEGFIPVIDSIRRKTTVYGDKTLMSEFLLSRGCTLPDHSHPYEQTGYLISGRMLMKIGSDETELGPGDSWSIPEDMVHGARVLEDAHVVEVFAPPRPDYMPER